MTDTRDKAAIINYHCLYGTDEPFAFEKLTQFIHDLKQDQYKVVLTYNIDDWKGSVEKAVALIGADDYCQTPIETQQGAFADIPKQFGVDPARALFITGGRCADAVKEENLQLFEPDGFYDFDGMREAVATFSKHCIKLVPGKKAALLDLDVLDRTYFSMHHELRMADQILVENLKNQNYTVLLISDFYSSKDQAEAMAKQLQICHHSVEQGYRNISDIAAPYGVARDYTLCISTGSMAEAFAAENFLICDAAKGFDTVKEEAKIFTELCLG